MGFQFRQPRSKMPKLDITISSSQRTTVAGPSNMNQQRVIPETPSVQSDDPWCEDDDDEFFVLASQKADEVQAQAAALISQPMHLCDPDTSYTRFRQDVRPVHSTQLNHIDEFDMDEDIFSNVPDFVPSAQQPGTSTENKENNGRTAQTCQNDVRSTSDLAAKEQKEKIQNEYFAEKNKALKKQIDSLQGQLSKVNQKCTTKEGEASTLRYEVDSKNREIDKLRKERMEEAVEMEKKYSEQIFALEKKIEMQRTELEFKVKSIKMCVVKEDVNVRIVWFLLQNLEILNKKSRKSLNDSVAMEPGGSSTSVELYNLFKLHPNPLTFPGY